MLDGTGPLRIITSNNTWADAVGITGYGGNIPDTVSVNNETISLIRASDELLLGEFTDPYYEAPAVPQPTLVNTVSLTGKNWINFGFSYQHEATDATNTYYEYNMSDEPTNGVYFIAYNWTTKKWFDTNPTNYQNTFGTSSTDLNTTSREITENPAVLYVFDTSPRLQLSSPTPTTKL